MKSGQNNQKWIISRKNPKTGYKETTIYTGVLNQKPKGWKVERST